MKVLRKTKLAACAVILAMLALLSGCSSVMHSAGDGIVRTFYRGGTATEDGYYMQNFTDSKVLFYDYKAKQTVPVCNKPDCQHDDPSACAAYMEKGYGFSQLIAYNNSIYYFVNDSFTQVSIIKTSADNSNRVTLAVDDTISDVHSVTAIDNKLYYNGIFYLYSEDDEDEIVDSVYTVHCLDLETNKVSVLLNKEGNPKKRIIFEGCSKDYLYYYEAIIGDEVGTTVVDGVEYETESKLAVNLKKISLSTSEETVIRDASDFVFDYYDSHGAYFIIKKGENEFDFCMLDYNTGELNKLFTTERAVRYIITDEDRILYSYPNEKDEAYQNRNCFVFDKKKKTTQEVNFTEAGYCDFRVCAEHGDWFIGDFVYDNRQFRAMIKKDDFFNGKLNYDLILNNRSGMPDDAPDVTDAPEKPAEYDSSKLVWVIDDFFIDDISQPKLETLGEGSYGYEKRKLLEDLLRQKGITLDIEFKMLYVPTPGVGETPSLVGALEYLIDKGEQIDIVSYYDGESLACFADLTEYLETEKGKKVKAEISENVWEALGDMDGKNCFVPFIKALRGRQSAYYVNKTLMEANGLKESDLAKSLSELTEIFEKVKSDKFDCFLATDFHSCIAYPRFSQLDDVNVCPFLSIDTEKPKGRVENIYENPEIIAQLKILSGWSEKKMISQSDEKPDLVADSTYTGKRTDGSNIIIPMGEVYADANVRSKALTVCRTSQNMDAAFEAIALSILDPEIYAAMNLWNWSVAPETEMKKYDSWGFYADFAPVQKEYNECRKIMNDRFNEKTDPKTHEPLPNYGNPWCGEMADVELGLKELNAELKAAGLDKVVEELNRQLDKFYNRKN